MSKRVKDITGQRIGKLVVIRCLDEKPSHYAKYLCRCDCGKEITVPYYRFARGVRSCGCDKLLKRNNMQGQVIGSLTVLELVERDDLPAAMIWKCRCDCGNDNCKHEVYYPTILLKNKVVTSCGAGEEIDESLLAHAKSGKIEGTNTFLLQSALDGKLYENNTTGVRGVHYLAKEQRYVATIVFKGKFLYITSSSTLDKAAKARKKIEDILFGGFMEHYKSDVEPEVRKQNDLAIRDIVMQAQEEKRESTKNETEGQIAEGKSIEEQATEGLCLICGKPLPAGKRKYCSYECYQIQQKKSQNDARRREEPIYCLVCGREIPSNRTKYCSHECMAIGIETSSKKGERKTKAKKTYEATCVDCGKTVVSESPLTQRCPECKRARKNLLRKDPDALTRKVGSQAVCERCGKVFLVAAGTQKYCSRCGALASRKKPQKKPAEPKMKECSCRVCGKIFTCPINSNRVYCSEECRVEGVRRYYVEKREQQKIAQENS